MDRSLDEIISERPERPRGGGGGRGRRGDRRPRPTRAPRREEFPRDGVRKYQASERTEINSDWVHDRFEDEHYDRAGRRPPVDDTRYNSRQNATGGTRIRIDNLHYDLTEDDLRDLFDRIGPVESVRLLYDRQDRSQGTAYVIYQDHQDARLAVSEFDGCNANGQPIRLTLMPTAPAPQPRSLMDRIDKAPRSIMDRITGALPDALSGRADHQGGGERRRRNRSDSPAGSGRLAPPGTDRYQPGRGSRSPIRRRGTPRESGRRPGQRREEGARGPRRPRTDEDGRPVVGGRPKKTAEELDAEMADYFGTKNSGATGSTDGALPATNGANGGTTGDVDMDTIE